MMVKKIIVQIIVFSAVLGLVFLEAIEGEIIASVNGKPIKEWQLRDKVNNVIYQTYFHKNPPPEKMREIKIDALDSLIEEELLYQEAKRQKIKVDKKEVTLQFKKIEQKFQSSAEFKRALKEQGYSEKKLKKKLERDYLIKEVYRKNVLEQLRLREQDLLDYYSQNKEKFIKPESVNLQHILIKVKDPASTSSWEAAQKRAIEIKDRLNSGEDFADLASQVSDDMYHIKGGHLGYVHRGRLHTEIEEVAFSSRPGEISAPIRTYQGYHIIKVLDRREPQLLKFVEVKDELKEELEKKLEQKEKGKWLAALKSDADIQVLVAIE